MLHRNGTTKRPRLFGWLADKLLPEAWWLAPVNEAGPVLLCQCRPIKRVGQHLVAKKAQEAAPGGGKAAIGKSLWLQELGSQCLLSSQKEPE